MYIGAVGHVADAGAQGGFEARCAHRGRQLAAGHRPVRGRVNPQAAAGRADCGRRVPRRAAARHQPDRSAHRRRPRHRHLDRRRAGGQPDRARGVHCRHARCTGRRIAVHVHRQGGHAGAAGAGRTGGRSDRAPAAALRGDAARLGLRDRSLHRGLPALVAPLRAHRDRVADRLWIDRGGVSRDRVRRLRAGRELGHPSWLDRRRSGGLQRVDRLDHAGQFLLPDDADGGRDRGRQRAQGRAHGVGLRVGTPARGRRRLRRRAGHGGDRHRRLDPRHRGARPHRVRAAGRPGRPAAAARRMAGARDRLRIPRARSAGRVSVTLPLVSLFFRHSSRMTNFDSFLSRAGLQMQESAIRKMGSVIASGRDVISFAPGYPAPETFPWDDFAAIAAELLATRDGHVLQYGPTRGYRPLLEAIAAIMQHRDVPVPMEELLVTTGSQQGLDLIARVLIDPGDVILVELPTYVGAISAFRNVQATMIGVPQEADGIDLDALDRTYAQLAADGRRVKFLYVVPNFQNPTGLLIGRDKRHRLLEWAERRDVLIVEDDPYRELYFEDATSVADVHPIKAADRSGRVIYLSSFSKTLAPGYRVAWMAAAPPLAAEFGMGEQAEDLLTGSLDQRVVYEACKRGVLDRQLPMLRAHYAHKRDVMQDALKRELGDLATWPRPNGGFFLWLTLPPSVDADRMIARAIEEGVVYVAGEAFYVNGEGRNTLRLSFSAPTPERIEIGVTRLGRALRVELAAPATAAAAADPAAS